jgi:Icc-related predicted phosphoesterase
MKICCVSDLHGQLPNIPECDLLLISGDICPDRGEPEKRSVFGGESLVYDRCGSAAAMFYQSQWLMGTFREWLDKIPAKHVVACWGNHDYIGQRRPDMVPTNLRWHLLTDQMVEIEGIKIWGTPWSVWYYDWAFNSPPRDEGGEEFLARKFSVIPEGCDIIISHGPPADYGDHNDAGKRSGSYALIETVKRVKPQLLVCGHIHEGYGVFNVEVGNSTAIVANASVLNLRYELTNPPLVFEISPRAVSDDGKS